MGCRVPDNSYEGLTESDLNEWVGEWNIHSDVLPGDLTEKGSFKVYAVRA